MLTDTSRRCQEGCPVRKALDAPCSGGSFSSDRIVVRWCGLRLSQSSLGFSSTGAEFFGFLVL